MSLVAMGLSILPVSAPAVTVDGLMIGLIERIAVGFGLLWTVINFNQYFPIAQTSVENLNDRFFDESADRVAVDDANLPSVDVFLPAYHNRMWVVAYRDVPSSYPQSVLSDRERRVFSGSIVTGNRPILGASNRPNAAISYNTGSKIPDTLVPIKLEWGGGL